VIVSSCTAATNYPSKKDWANKQPRSAAAMHIYIFLFFLCSQKQKNRFSGSRQNKNLLIICRGEEESVAAIQERDGDELLRMLFSCLQSSLLF